MIGHRRGEDCSRGIAKRDRLLVTIRGLPKPVGTDHIKGQRIESGLAPNLIGWINLNSVRRITLTL